MIALNHFQKVHYVQISVELFNSFVQVGVFFRFCTGFKSTDLLLCRLFSFTFSSVSRAASYSIAEIVGDGLVCVIAKRSLIEDEMEDIEELLAAWDLTDQSFARISEIIHENLILVLHVRFHAPDY